jgi:hypothetical protein
MAYTTIEGYLCERCGYRWASRNGTGLRDKKDPRVCAKCKSPYWNKPRKNKLPRDRWANIWARQAEGITAPE